MEEHSEIGCSDTAYVSAYGPAQATIICVCFYLVTKRDIWTSSLFIAVPSSFCLDLEPRFAIKGPENWHWLLLLGVPVYIVGIYLGMFMVRDEKGKDSI